MEKKKSTSKIAIVGLFVVIIIIIAFVIYGIIADIDWITNIFSERSSKSETPMTVEYKLAVINASSQLPSTHPSIEKFRKLLISIESKCKNNRDQISDISVAAWKDLNENEKVKISLFELMNELDKSIPKESIQLKNVLDFSEVAAAYITLRVSIKK